MDVISDFHGARKKKVNAETYLKVVHFVIKSAEMVCTPCSTYSIRGKLGYKYNMKQTFIFCRSN